uniref:Uncharacterized protein n=1 Tax=Rhizophora mucronata TaxID=61149 RepID=A0A2P2PBU3_RHIMU
MYSNQTIRDSLIALYIYSMSNVMQLVVITSTPMVLSYSTIIKGSFCILEGF